MDNVSKYSSRIAYSEEDEGYIATVPELPGCSAFGSTAAEALSELSPAIEAWISAAKAAGNPVPQPAALDAELPSGKFLVRVAKTVHAQLSNAAQREGVSLNQYVGTILATATLGDIYSRAVSTTTHGPGTTVTMLDSPYVSTLGFNRTITAGLVHSQDLVASGSHTVQFTGARIRAVQAQTYAPGIVVTQAKPVKRRRDKDVAVHG